MLVSWAEWGESVQAAWQRGGREEGVECPNIHMGTAQLCPADIEQLGRVCWRGTGWREGLPQALSSAPLGAVALRTCRQHCDGIWSIGMDGPSAGLSR